MFSLPPLKTAWRPSDPAGARCPVPSCPAHSPLLNGAGSNHPNPRDLGDLFLDDATALRVNILVQEGALRRACVTLTQDLPGSITAEVLLELKCLHPAWVGSAMCTRELPLRPALTLSPESFNRQPRHLKKASRCVRSDHVLRLRVSTWPHLWAQQVPPRSARRSAVSHQRFPWWSCATASRTPWSMGTTVEAQLTSTRWPP